ncbi:MAG TPA: hypothetical protein VFS07_01795 [Gemmatimonadales bacterium]|nr:hypothetical protein [Gemmatimonadales bacterium]
MKRSALWFAGLALAAVAAPAQAQLNMQMGNGWNFSFSGNVNGFLVYESTSDKGTTAGGLVGANTKGFNIRTGLLPSFAVFSVKGRDGGRDLGATFGFAPEIQCGPGSSNFTNNANCQGSQIDMRQVFMTVGGVGGGQLLMGRELSLFGRQNILNDMTLMGTGPTGGPNGGGTTLGRIGFGYNYPNFNAQLTWSSAAGKNSQFSIGLFDPSAVDNFTETQLPRVEAEWTMKSESGTMFWVNGLAQSAKDPGADQTLTSFGAGGGVKWTGAKISLVGSGFYGSGIGSTLNFLNATDGADGRTSFGAYGQGMFTLNDRTSLGVSYGLNQLKGTDAEGGGKLTNSALVAGLYNKYGKMLRSTLEFTYNQSSDDVSGNENNTGFVLSGGLLLLF